MKCSLPIVAAAAMLTLGWGAGAALLGLALGWNPVIAPLLLAVPIAGCGVLYRGRDVVDALAPLFFVCYAGFIGLAYVRAMQPDLVMTPWTVAPLATLWPAILVGGIPIALILTVFVALPASRIPLRRRAAGARETPWRVVGTGVRSHG